MNRHFASTGRSSRSPSRAATARSGSARESIRRPRPWAAETAGSISAMSSHDPRTGVRRIASFPVDGLPTDAGGEIPEFDPKALAIPKHRKALTKSLKYMARDIQLAVAAAEMAVAGAIGVLLLAAALRRLGRGDADRRLVLGVVALLPLLLGGVILTRFDLVPAALVTGALLLVLCGRLHAGSVVVGIGVAVKLYPAVLLPLLGVLAWRRGGRREVADGNQDPVPDQLFRSRPVAHAVQLNENERAAERRCRDDAPLLALVATDDGVYVAHGVGAFGIRFYISYFGPGEVEPRFTYQVAQPVTSMDAWQAGVVFGTGNSNVGYLDPATPEAPTAKPAPPADPTTDWGPSRRPATDAPLPTVSVTRGQAPVAEVSVEDAIRSACFGRASRVGVSRPGPQKLHVTLVVPTEGDARDAAAVISRLPEVKAFAVTFEAVIGK